MVFVFLKVNSVCQTKVKYVLLKLTGQFTHNGMTGSKISVKFVNSHWSAQIKLFCLRPISQICFAAVNKLFTFFTSRQSLVTQSEI